MPASPLARIQPVPLRAVWTSESQDFTPWLARPENLTLQSQNNSQVLGDTPSSAS